MSSEDKDKLIKKDEDQDKDKDKEIEEPKKEEMRREINYENNSDMSIDQLKEITELKFRKDFNKWVVVAEEKQKKSNYFFGIFN